MDRPFHDFDRVGSKELDGPSDAAVEERGDVLNTKKKIEGSLDGPHHFGEICTSRLFGCLNGKRRRGEGELKKRLQEKRRSPEGKWPLLLAKRVRKREFYTRSTPPCLEGWKL